MEETYKVLHKKVEDIFRDLPGAKADRLAWGHYPKDLEELLTQVLEEDFGPVTSKGISFHIVADCAWDLAALVAIILVPEKFTQKEISEILYRVVCHTPDHFAAAAKLFGHPVTDVFDVGALEGDCED